ncbi:conserved Plasmodium protein, unknown function [Plasmodium sp. DRC-Itaito]|nr:conserved Plasmodium protein, unknown function [Plasmodium sp. DRC-Itaito]
MNASENNYVDLEPFNSILDRKYFPYFFFLFEIYSFISIFCLFDYNKVNRTKQSIKTNLILCFIASINIGLSIYFLLLYFDVCI